MCVSICALVLLRETYEMQQEISHPTVHSLSSRIHTICFVGGIVGGIKGRAADMSFCSWLVKEGGCHTRHGEHIHFLWPWACTEALLGGLITQCEPGARGVVGGACVTPTMR